MPDIFDLQYLDDIPDSLKDELIATKTNELSGDILSLFEIKKGNLNIDEIMVALYRKYQIKMTRRKVNTKLHNMKLDGLIRSVEGKKGVFAKDESVKEALRKLKESGQ